MALIASETGRTYLVRSNNDTVMIGSNVSFHTLSLSPSTHPLTHLPILLTKEPRHCFVDVKPLLISPNAIYSATTWSLELLVKDRSDYSGNYEP